MTLNRFVYIYLPIIASTIGIAAIIYLWITRGGRF